MKKILLLLFTSSFVSVCAQSEMNCYHVQEFLWNPKTLAYDTPSEHKEISAFKVDMQRKELVQTFEDGGAVSVLIKSESDVSPGIHQYKVISPSNGYRFVYRVNMNSHVLEVLLDKGGEEILLKKYLFRA